LKLVHTVHNETLLTIRQVIPRGNKLHYVGFIKLETTVPAKNSFIFNWSTHTEQTEMTINTNVSHETEPVSFKLSFIGKPTCAAWEKGVSILVCGNVMSQSE
jgi:hypothetical protein